MGMIDRLYYLFDLDTKKYQSSAAKADSKTNKLAGSMGNKLTKAIGTAAVAYLGARGLNMAINTFIGSAMKQEEIFKKLESAVNLTGVSYADAKPKIDNYLSALQATTRYGDTDAAPALQQITMLTGSLAKGFEGTEIAADLASSGLFDLNTASRYVAMAMNGEVTMLGRYIPELKESAGLVNKNMTATEKWAIAKDLLNSKFGGMAQKDLDTFAGRMNQLQNYMGDLAEAIGDPMIKLLTPMLKDWVESAKYLNEYFANAKAGIKGFAEEVGIADVTLTGFGDKLKLYLRYMTAFTTFGISEAFVALADKVVEKGAKINAEAEKQKETQGEYVELKEHELNLEGRILSYLELEWGLSGDILKIEKNIIKAKTIVLTQAEKSLKAWNDIIAVAKGVVQLIASPMVNAVGAVVDGLWEGRAAFKSISDFASSIIKQLVIMIVKAATFAAIMSSVGLGGFGGLFKGFLGFHEGGMVKKAHTGLMVKPDERLILAQAGEGIINKRATAAIGGEQAIDTINRTGGLPAGGQGGNTISINIGSFIGEESWVRENLVPILEQASELGYSRLSLET